MLDSVAADSVITAGHVVYVDFWASWCLPCRKSFPWMKDMLERYRKQGLQVVTVNLDHDPKAARKFLADMQSPLPVVFDSKGSLAKLYHLEVMPTSFIYGRDGKLRERHQGFQPDNTWEVESLIRSLLAERKTQ